MTDTERAIAKSILQYLRSHDLTPAQRDLLTADYANRRFALDEDDRHQLDDSVLNSFLGRDARRSIEDRSAASRSTIERLPGMDIAVLTILPVELRAVCDVFESDQQKFRPDENGQRYFDAYVASPFAPAGLNLVITLAEGPYDLHAAAATEALLRRYDRIGAYFLVGIAAGNKKKLTMGDVIVPRIVTNVDAARSQPEGLQARPRTENLPRAMAINLNHYAAQNYPGFDKKAAAFYRALRVEDRPADLPVRQFRPKISFSSDTMGVGAKLLADGTTLDVLRGLDQRLIAFDQDSYGFANTLREKWWAIFRGISDYGDPEKADNWHYLAAATAAIALKNFLETHYVPPSSRS